MAAEDKFFLNQKPAQKTGDSLYLEGYSKHWGERVAFTVGFSYIMGLSSGCLIGLFSGMRKAKKGRYGKSAYISAGFARFASRCGNACGSASLLYVLTGKLIDLLFEEEIQDVGQMTRNVVTGGVSGLLYKSTLGFRPMCVGGILGAIAVTGVTYTLNGLNEAGYINFRANV
jgi:hypothetical protein